MNSLSECFNMVLFMSATASILAAAIFAIKSFTGKKLSPEWHYYIWFLVIIRLVLPFSPESPTSIFNLISEVRGVVWTDNASDNKTELLNVDKSADNIEKVPGDLPQSGNLTTYQGSNNEAGMQGEVNVDSDYNAPIVLNPIDPIDNTVNDVKNVGILNGDSAKSVRETYSLYEILLFCWLAGMLLMLVLLLSANYRFSRKAGVLSQVDDEETLSLIEECKRALKINRKVNVYKASSMISPCLVGIFRPRILVSERSLMNLDRINKKNLLMHELVHLKRNDNILLLICCVLSIIHWFNPVMWWTFKKIRIDGEKACDNKVMMNINSEEVCSYGNLIVNMSEYYMLSALPGGRFLGGKSGLKDRIGAIVSFNRNARYWSIAGLLAVVVIGALFLTGPLKNSDKTVPAAANTGTPTGSTKIPNDVPKETGSVNTQPNDDNERDYYGDKGLPQSLEYYREMIPKKMNNFLDAIKSRDIELLSRIIYILDDQNGASYPPAATRGVLRQFENYFDLDSLNWAYEYAEEQEGMGKVICTISGKKGKEPSGITVHLICSDGQILITHPWIVHYYELDMIEKNHVNNVNRKDMNQVVDNYIENNIAYVFYGGIPFAAHTVIKTDEKSGSSIEAEIAAVFREYSDNTEFQIGASEIHHAQVTLNKDEEGNYSVVGYKIIEQMENFWMGDTNFASEYAPYVLPQVIRKAEKVYGSMTVKEHTKKSDIYTGNGEIETIKLKILGKYRQEYILEVGQASIYGKGHGIEAAFNTVDMDSGDKYKEIAVSEYGPSDDDYTNFYWYDGEKIRYTGGLEGFVGHSESRGGDRTTIKIDGSGIVYARTRSNFIGTWFYADGHRVDEKHRLVDIPQETYEINWTSKVKVPIPLRKSFTDDEIVYQLKEGETVKFSSIGSNRWLLVEVSDGTKGWIEVESDPKGWPIIVSGTELDIHDVFEGLPYGAD